MSARQVKNTSFFQPTVISGCKMWFDAFDASYTTSGNNVTGWTNKSGNSSATGTTGVLINQTTLMGKSSLRMSSSNLTMGPITYSTHFRNFFVVANFVNTQQLIVGDGNTSIGGAPTTGYYSDIELNYPGRNGLVAANPSGNFGVPCILSLSSSTGNAGIWVTGTSQTITTNNLTPTFFATGTASSQIIGSAVGSDFFELIVYDGIMTSLQRQSIEGYLAWKWGLNRSLPSTHPYYTVQSYATTLYYPKSITKITSTNITHPLAIAGLSLWLDGQDIRGTGSSYPTGSTVTTWTDKSGNQRNATASSGGVSYTMAFGIYPGLVFTNSQYLLGNISITGNTLSIFSMFSLANQGTGGAGRLIGLAATGQNDYNSGSYMGLLRQGGTSFGPYRNGTFTGNTVSYDTPTIMEAWYDGTNQFSIINGGLTPLSNAFSGNFSISSYAVANNTNLGDIPNGPLYGSIGEVIVYNISPTQSQRQLIEGYLAWKWGRQASLAAGHPYQTVVPMYPPYVNPVVRSIVNRPLV